MKGIIPFYQLFYGLNFYRYFTRPPDFIPKYRFQVKFTIKDAKQLYLHISKNNGFHPCYASIYDYGIKDNLNQNIKTEPIVYDRVFFDFDIDNNQAYQLKKQIQDLRSRGPNHQKMLQDDLKEKLRNLILDEKIAKPAIDEAKIFSIQLKKWFGSYPILFFSGCKGCHAYIFFEPINNVDINRSLTWFAEKIKNNNQYQTLDLSVNKNAKTRVSRVPFSKHQYTGLTVVPFQVNDTYEEIMTKSLSPGIGFFTREAYYSNFGEYLQEIDPILKHNVKIQKENQIKVASVNKNKSYKSIVDDHRLFFKSILGEPIKEYSDKEYVMYHCPFQDHEDNNPSFRVYKTGYQCYGCNRKGNYFQFLKDYNKWSDKEVKIHLRDMERK
jgi:hypothetical protein